MDLKSKFNNIGGTIRKNFQKLQNAHLSDLWSAYRKFLKRIPDISHLKNIVLFGGISTFIIFILFNQRFASLYQYLPKEPVAGGTYIEGVVGNVKQFNPLFSQINPAEISVNELIFSGLTKKNDKKEIISDLAEKWEMSADGKSYTFHLKNDLKWQDGENLTADDVIFTIETIQNPDTRTSYLKIWKGVTAKKVDDKTVSFTLTSPYSGFLANTDLPIIPKHVLADVPAKSIKTSEFSLKPIGSGPFVFSEMKTIRDSQEISLLANENYYGHLPYLDEVVIKTYRNYSDLVGAYTKKEITGMEKISGRELANESKLPNISIYNTAIPESDIIYFNLRAGVTKEKYFREALAMAMPRAEILDKVYRDYGVSIFTPILPGYIGYNPKLKTAMDLEAAKAKIIAAGYTLDKDGMMVSGGNILTVRLVCLDDYEKVYEAEIIRDNLKKIGVDVQIEKYPTASFFQDHVKNRDFDILLLTQNLGYDSDIYSFWHSTQANDPGLNFSGLSDRRVDKFLEQARTFVEIEKREERYKDAQQVIWDEAAAIPLVWPNYIYAVSNQVKGVGDMKLSDPKDRFWNIENWYIYDKKATVI